MYHQKVLKKNSPWAQGLPNRKKQKEEEDNQFEPMIDYKYPTIVSGATTIGSAERAPDRK
jgi:hypothetical protein